MKISLKLANGAALEFEGDQAEFDRVSEFLAEPPDSFTAASSDGSHGQRPVVGTENPPEARVERLTPAAVETRLREVGAATDQERMTVMAQMALDAGEEGIDFKTLTWLYEELGLMKPSQFPSKTLSNAKYAGLVRPVKQGVWRTTYKGENFAKGHGRGNVASRRSTRPTPSPSDEGGAPD